VIRRPDCCHRILALLACAAGSLFPAAAQPTLPNAALLAPTNVIPPTVTAAMGDVGGKFFGKTPDPAKTRRYYIAAEPQLWDYAPEGRDPVCGKPLPPPVMNQRNGGKLRYIEYTDETFSTRLIASPRLGILGPVLGGMVGETLAVTFVNRTARPLSMHPHGVKYDKDSEGAYYEPKPGLGAAVGPGATFTYVWHLDEHSGPLPGEPASKGWHYHSHVMGDEESNLGLVGFIIVTDPKRARPDGTPNDVDREMASLFMIFDESGLGEAEKEAAEYASLPGNTGVPPKPWAQVQEILEQGERAAINGYIFGNLPGLEMVEGERVRWYLFGLGGQVDFHTAHWHGLKVVEEGRRRTDVVELLPASMKVADMAADNPGDWLFHCHVAEHMMEGMFARFTVHPRDLKSARPALEQPFFGLRDAQTSLQVKRAEARMAGAAGKDGSLTMEGTVTVFQAFSIFTQRLTIRLGEKSVSFKPDRRGLAEAGGVTFRARNASQYGVVYGGLMEFDLTLNGSDWLAEFRRAGKLESGTPLKGAVTDVPFSMDVGKARHTAKARFTVATR
jgi:FtsP/CotA-like multicopper oxidase with cupredoxin domain